MSSTSCVSQVQDKEFTIQSVTSAQIKKLFSRSTVQMTPGRRGRQCKLNDKLNNQKKYRRLALSI